MAAVCTDQKLFFVSEEGDHFEGKDLMRPAACSALVWHPKEMICASGWEDGTVSFLSGRLKGYNFILKRFVL